MFGKQIPIRPETVNAFEIGFKGQTSDGRYALNADIYQANYDAMQVQAAVTDYTTGVTTNFQTNVGTARTRGFEVESTQRPFDGFSLEENVSFTEANFNMTGNSCPVEFQTGAISVALSAIVPANTCYKFLGSTAVQLNTFNGQLPSAPKWKFHFSPRYDVPITNTGYSTFVQLDVNYLSRQLFGLTQDPLLAQKSYALVNGSIGLYDDGGRYQLRFFVNNMFDQLYYTTVGHATELTSPTNFNNLTAIIPRDAHRYVGLSLSVSY